MRWLSPWIHTTDICNLKCTYCYVTGKNTMEQPVYDALEKLILNSGADLFKLRFAGGEPLIVFNKWRKFAEKMLNHPQTRIEILTNLRQIPKGFVSFAQKKNVNISVSIDAGFKNKVLDSTIVQHMERIKNPYWVMTTLTEDNLVGIMRLANFIGAKKYGWAISTDYFWKGEPSFEKLTASMVAVIQILKRYRYNFDNFMFNNMDFSTSNARGSGCCAGNEMFSVYCDGSICQCQTLNKQEKIGDVFHGYKRTQRKTNEICTKCSIRDYCSCWCPLYHKPGNRICDLMKFVAYEILVEKEI
jgi:sulfatase maturation enzyme AslB (radical SAM superfamily)